MAGSRVSLYFESGRKLRDLFQMATVRLVELQFLDPALCSRVSCAVTSAVNNMSFGCVAVDGESRAVRCDVAAITDKIGEAFTVAGVQPGFLKPAYRPDGLGWFRHVGWRLDAKCTIASALAGPNGVAG